MLGNRNNSNKITTDPEPILKRPKVEHIKAPAPKEEPSFEDEDLNILMFGKKKVKT